MLKYQGISPAVRLGQVCSAAGSSDSFSSGAGHVFYALLGIMAAGILVAPKDARWSIAIVGLAAAVFADLWAHGYTH
jgi:hypothetical protein